MGCFSCFDSKEEQKLNPGKKKDYASEGKPMAESHFAKLSSGEFWVVYSDLCTWVLLSYSFLGFGMPKVSTFTK